MNYLDEAFKQLAFAWKLYNYARDGKMDYRELDIPITFQDQGMVLVLPDRIFNSADDFILALQNNLSVAFGAAAITLNRCREEAGISVPNPIVSETDQFAAVTSQIRNAFAHDISEPRWEIRTQSHRRAYDFGDIHLDLTSVHEKAFEYADIGGPDVLFRIKEYAQRNLWPHAVG